MLVLKWCIKYMSIRSKVPPGLVATCGGGAIRGEEDMIEAAAELPRSLRGVDVSLA